MIGYCEIQTKQLEPIIVKLFRVVGDDYPQDPKLAYDIFLDEIIGIPFSDFGKRRSLYPLVEIICGN